MAKQALITLIKSGNRIVIDPTTENVKSLVEPRLTFLSKRFLYGKERWEQKRRMEINAWECFTNDHRGRLCTSLGFYDRLVNVLRGHGYTVKLNDLTPAPAITPRWDRLFDPEWNITLRTGQEEFLVKVMSRIARGLPSRFDCPPGFGKSFLIGLIAFLLPDKRIDVLTKRVPVLCDRIYPDLCGMLPDVGICCGKMKRNRDARVRLYSLDSLHNSTGDADIMIGDEAHEFAADRAAMQVGQKYERSINVGLSATHDMRLDNKDMRTEGMFGPVVFKMSYQEAVDGGLIVPLVVKWSNCVMDFDPCENEENDVERMRLGIWRNTTRNEIIAANAKADAEESKQNLITCQTIEHAFALKKLLPEWQVVYAVNGLKAEDVPYYRRQGLMPDNLPDMNQERMKMLTTTFERGKLLNAIVTTCWNVGVSFNHLLVTNRADAGGSPIMDTQIPGRASRINEDIGKLVGTIRDYKDQFNRGFKQRATKRRHNYETHGWAQEEPGGSHAGEKPQHLLWEDE